jgi:hypothetical protein
MGLLMMLKSCCVLNVLVGLTFPVPLTAQVPGVAVKPDAIALNPAFRFTAEEVRTAESRGEDLARRGKKLDEVIAPNRCMPRWTRVKAGNAHESEVYCLTLGAASEGIEGYRAVTEYRKPDISEDVLKSGYAATEVRFRVVLTSVSHMKRSGITTKEAADTEVTVKKFVLDDGLGHVYPIDAEGSLLTKKNGEQEFAGKTPSLSHVHSSGTVFGNGGMSTVNGNATVTQYTRWTAEKPWFSATYDVSFPLFNPDGTCRIGTGVRIFALHIVTDAGELTATYDLTAWTSSGASRGRTATH